MKIIAINGSAPRLVLLTPMVEQRFTEMLMNRKLLFFDIDGTLVSFKTHEIPASAIDALSAAKSRGHRIIISTGRPKAIINNIAEIEPLIDGYITMNGAYCFTSERILYSSPVPHHDVMIISHTCEEHNIPCIFVNEHEFRIAGANSLSQEVFSNQLNVPNIPSTDYIAPTKEPVYQLTPFFNAKMQKEMAALTPECEYGSWHPAFVDITAKGNTKAHGIDVFCDYYSVPLANTVAFGDGGNDIAMLRHAGIGVAMGNANQEVRNAADTITSSVDDDGIFNAIKNLSLM